MQLRLEPPHKTPHHTVCFLRLTFEGMEVLRRYISMNEYARTSTSIKTADHCLSKAQILVS